MVTNFSDSILSYYTWEYKKAKELLIAIQKIKNGEISLDDFNKSDSFTIGGLPTHFSLLEVETEIRQNILKIKNENLLLQYFYYLLKIFQDLKIETSRCFRYIELITKLNEKEFGGQVITTKDKYSSIDELILHCYMIFSEVSVSSIKLYMILKKEFGFKVKDWREKVVNQEQMPSFFDIKKMFLNPANELETKKEEIIQIPLHKFKWKGTPAQLAFIINLLEEKGYIDGLTPYGERNAKILLTHFDIEGHNTTYESLGKYFQQLKKDELPINPEDAAKFQRLPKRNDLKK